MKITVSGYASPLHTDDYNHILSQRRIASFLNLLRAWKGGALHEALSNGHLRIVRKPMGEDPFVSDGDPVYGLSAARARRIEITKCEIF